MKHIRTLALMITIISCPLAFAQSKVATKIPEAFVGRWAINLKECKKPPEETYFEIKPKEIYGYESTGLVKAVVTRGALEMAVITETSGEGETWLDAETYKLSADKQRLTGSSQDPKDVMYRCP